MAYCGNVVAAGLSIDDFDTNFRVLKLSFELDFIKYCRLVLFIDWFTDEIAATYRPLTLVKWICLCANIADMQILCSSGFKVQEGSITMTLFPVVY